ncbi:MAG TPA: NAD-dependent epimerase/dehydratase family protein [Ignavibacteria bacterium]
MDKEKKIIIYGGGGFIGSHLCDKLLDEGYSVTIFDKLNFNKQNLTHNLSRIKIIEGDFNNEIDIRNSLKNIDVVFHLVSSTLPANSNDNPVYDVETNLISSLHLFDECVINNIKKIIFISSGGTIYGIPEILPIKETHSLHPICSYGIIKKTIEDYLFMFNKIYGLEYNVFRLSNPYGERQNPFVSQGVIPVFLRKIIKNEKIEIWGDGEVTRDYIYIKDAVELIVKSIDINSSSKVFNLSSSIGYSLNQIISIMKNITRVNTEVIYKKERDIDVPVNILDNSLAVDTFNWRPVTDIKLGIESTYNYLKNVIK